MSTADLEFSRFDGPGAREIRDTVEEIYIRSYVDAIEHGGPFHSPQAFMHRFDTYAARDGFDMVVAYHNGTPVGQTWGWPLEPGAGWWDGLLTEVPPGFTDETGTRTFALSEIMVDDRHQGQGIAHRLHDQLLAARHEERATLLVEPDNEGAYRAYKRWGWQPVGQLRPAWPDAPIWDVLILPLPVQAR